MTKEERQEEISRAHTALHRMLDVKQEEGVSHTQTIARVLYGLGVHLASDHDCHMGFIACAIAEHLDPDASKGRGGHEDLHRESSGTNKEFLQ